MQAAAGAGRTGGGGDAGTRGSGSSVLQGAEPRPPVLPDAAAATSPGDTSATGRHGAGGRAVGGWGGAARASGAAGGRRLQRVPSPPPCAPLLACAVLSPPGEPADPPLLLPRLPPSSHVTIRLPHGLRLRLWPSLSPSPAGRARLAPETVTSGGRRSRAWSVPGEEDGGAVSWWRDRC